MYTKIGYTQRRRKNRQTKNERETSYGLTLMEQHSFNKCCFKIPAFD